MVSSPLTRPHRVTCHSAVPDDMRELFWVVRGVPPLLIRGGLLSQMKRPNAPVVALAVDLVDLRTMARRDSRN